MEEQSVRLDSNAIMSQAVVHGGTVYLAGQVALTPHAPVAQQTGEVLDKIDALLARSGSDRSMLLSALIHLVDRDDYAEMNSVWSSWLADAPKPARTTVVAALALPGLAVEITIVAAVARQP